MIILEIDPDPLAVLDSLHERSPHIAEMIEESLDWIEAGDLRSRRRLFTNGAWMIQRTVAESAWIIVWEFDEDVAVVRFLGESSSF